MIRARRAGGPPARQRLKDLIEEYQRREEPDGEAVNIFWSMHLQPGD